ncbi:hypothetical protein [uncultured Thiohalocapsa sp.]|uniref:hypothetical protein n=1 Tax=uncultured Thiohalocapsa sp. TaxID=768990 RepID=UPI0025FF805C|nr:hypothetical protein [uncultured Thiohalocapsa sp.]
MRLKSRARLQRVSIAREHVSSPLPVAGERTFQQLGRQGPLVLGDAARWFARVRLDDGLWELRQALSG